MTIKVLDILVEGETAGSIILNGPKGTVLKRFNIKPEYERRLTRKNLLVQGQDYWAFNFEDYVSIIQNALSRDIGKEISIREKKLPVNVRGRLLRQYSE